MKSSGRQKKKHSREGNPLVAEKHVLKQKSHQLLKKRASTALRNRTAPSMPPRTPKCCLMIDTVAFGSPNRIRPIPNKSETSIKKKQPAVTIKKYFSHIILRDMNSISEDLMVRSFGAPFEGSSRINNASARIFVCLTHFVVFASVCRMTKSFSIHRTPAVACDSARVPATDAHIGLSAKNSMHASVLIYI